MTDQALFLGYLVAVAILTITPGVDTAMVLRSALLGRRPAVFASVGILLGCLAWGGAVALGLGALLQVSALAYTLVKWAGAAYLIWLGCKLLLHHRTSVAAADPGDKSGDAQAFRNGLFTNLLNPKIGVFYITFLPQFVPPHAAVAAYTFFLVAIHLALTVVWFTALIAATAPLGRVLRTPRVVRALDRLTGLVFVGCGLKLAVSKA